MRLERKKKLIESSILQIIEHIIAAQQGFEKAR